MREILYGNACHSLTKWAWIPQLQHRAQLCALYSRVFVLPVQKFPGLFWFLLGAYRYDNYPKPFCCFSVFFIEQSHVVCVVEFCLVEGRFEGVRRDFASHIYGISSPVQLQSTMGLECRLFLIILDRDRPLHVTELAKALGNCVVDIRGCYFTKEDENQGSKHFDCCRNRLLAIAIFSRLLNWLWTGWRLQLQLHPR